MPVPVPKPLKKVDMYIQPGAKAIDVVCGMELDPTQTQLLVEYGGEVYYFCSPTCKNHFVNDSEKYVG